MSNRIINRLDQYEVTPGGFVRLGSEDDPARSINILRLDKDASHYLVICRYHHAEHDALGNHVVFAGWYLMYVFSSERCFVREAITNINAPYPSLSRRQFRRLKHLAMLDDEDYAHNIGRMLPGEMRPAAPREIENLQRELVSWKVVQ